MKMKKVNMILLAGILTGALVLTGCDRVSTSGSYSATAEKMGIIIPATGITLDEWCLTRAGMTYAQMLKEGYIPVLLYKDDALTQPFSGSDRLYANTPIYSEVNLMDVSRQQIGEISGTITLTDVPSPAPKVSISVGNIDNGNWWHSNGSYHWWNDSNQIDLSSDNYTNLSWSIPIYEDDRFSPSNGNFTLHVSLADNSLDFFWIDIPITPYISSVKTEGINLGTVSLKSITLSGTINITHNGQPVQYAWINAWTTDMQLIGFTHLDSPAANAPWTMTISAINSDVTFDVSGSGNDKWHFDRDNLSPVNVQSQDKSGIAINIGDIRTITLSGSIFVTYNGKQVPNVSINAETKDKILSHAYADLSSPANGASWSITIEAPDSEKTVYFNVYGSNGDNFSDETLFYRQYFAPVSVYNQDKSGIVLNLGNMTNYGKEDYDSVIDDYTRAIQIYPDYANVYHSRGFAYYNKGDFDLAIDDYTQAIRIDPNRASTFNNRGASYNKKGDYDLAIVDLDEAIRLNPNFENPYRHRAFAYMKKGNYKQARTDIDKALQINPDYQSAQELSAEIQKLGY
jgi:hypothetical protein